MITIKELAKEIKIINDELADIRTHLAAMNTDIAWIKKIQWFLVTTSVITLASVVVNLLMKVR